MQKFVQTVSTRHLEASFRTHHHSIPSASFIRNTITVHVAWYHHQGILRQWSLCLYALIVVINQKPLHVIRNNTPNSAKSYFHWHWTVCLNSPPSSLLLSFRATLSSSLFDILFKREPPQTPNAGSISLGYVLIRGLLGFVRWEWGLQSLHLPRRIRSFQRDALCSQIRKELQGMNLNGGKYFCQPTNH